MVKRTRGSGGTGSAGKVEGEQREQVTVYLPPQRWRSLKIYAAQHDREMSEVVAEALSRLGIQ